MGHCEGFWGRRDACNSTTQPGAGWWGSEDFELLFGGGGGTVCAVVVVVVVVVMVVVVMMMVMMMMMMMRMLARHRSPVSAFTHEFRVVGLYRVNGWLRALRVRVCARTHFV